MKWYLKAIKQYFDFTGRARRTEYWMFALFNFLFALAAIFIDILLEVNTSDGIEMFYLIYVLVTFIPGLAVTVRRLHDTGNSGWMLLVGIIPLVGPIWIFVLTLLDSVPGNNKWGANPKELHHA